MNEQGMSHPIHLDCLPLLHRLIFLITLPHSQDFPVALGWPDKTLLIFYFILKATYMSHETSTVMFVI